MAKSITQALEKYAPGKFLVEVADPTPKLWVKYYDTATMYFHSFHKQVFYSSNSKLGINISHQLSSFSLAPKMAKLIKKHRPDLVILNHPMMVSEITSVLKKLSFRPRIVIQLADPFITLKLWYATKNFDLYLSPTVESTTNAVKNGIPQDKITTVGWITREQFYHHFNSDKIRGVLGLNSDKKIIFVGGAGRGGGKIYETCRYLTANKFITANCQIIAIAGTSKLLYLQLARLAIIHPGIIFPYFDPKNLPELLAASDFAMGKAGPNFLFECVALGKPLLATGCPPNQEDQNLPFIKKMGLGWVHRDPKMAVKLAEKIISNPKMITEKLPYLAKIKRQNLRAKEKTAKAIMKLFLP